MKNYKNILSVVFVGFVCVMISGCQTIPAAFSDIGHAADFCAKVTQPLADKAKENKDKINYEMKQHDISEAELMKQRQLDMAAKTILEDKSKKEKIAETINQKNRIQ